MIHRPPLPYGCALYADGKSVTVRRVMLSGKEFYYRVESWELKYSRLLADYLRLRTNALEAT